MNKKSKINVCGYLGAVLCCIYAGGVLADAKLLTVPAHKVVPNKYIVVLKDSKGAVSLLNNNYVGERAKAAGTLTQGKVQGLLRNAVNGYVIETSEKEIQKLLKHSDVDYIEPVQTVTIDQTQSGPAWGLDRIDQQDLPLNNTYSYLNTGLGVNAYVIDTGINTTHSEFTGRIGNTVSFVGGNEDCNGHGTHVAGTLGGTTYGVAKSVTLHAVKVFGCANTTDTAYILQGIDWVRNNAIHPAVANMSLGGAVSTALNQATANLINSGVTAVVAAGNDTADACNKSPASTPDAITVGATNSLDNKYSLSNVGRCVDIWAPGENISSAWIGSSSATNSISGTSMASPHVAGAVAMYLQYNNAATPAQITKAIVAHAAVFKLSSSQIAGAPNRLLNITNMLSPITYIWTAQSQGFSNCIPGFAPPGGGRVGIVPESICSVPGGLAIDPSNRAPYSGVGPGCYAAYICQ